MIEKTKDAQSSVEGIYVYEPKPINDKSHWLQNSGSNAIWYTEYGSWAIGPIGEAADIISFDQVSSPGWSNPKDATTWQYYDGKQFISSDDIYVTIYTGMYIT